MEYHFPLRNQTTNSWMQQIYTYVCNTAIFHCPANKLVPVARQSWFNYFNGVRATYVAPRWT